jgi:hypothetical protein
LSHSFWGQAAAASGMNALVGSHPAQSVGLGTTTQPSSVVVAHAADQLSHLGSGTNGDISAVAATHVAPPVFAVDPHSAPLHLDTVSHASDFVHQMHI